MKVLIVGSGGREHAIIKSFLKSSLLKKIFILPGNAGIESDAEIVSVAASDFEGIFNFCDKQKIDFVFIGPEEPLVNGLTDYLRKKNILCVGPSQRAAQLEGSKIFAKEFMNRAKIPTAKSFVVKSVTETTTCAKNFTAPYILKADGLAAGKGVFICKTLADLERAATELFIHKKFGPAGESALLEENLPGWELSYLVLTNGETFELLPIAQDHKRLHDCDQGPNTGGMGTVAPKKISADLNKKIIEEIIAPSIQQIKNEDLLYRGVLFIGIMVVNNQPYTLEFNTRFGDPETQVILPLIENDTVDLFYKLSKGQLDQIHLNSKSAICLVNAAYGYPDQPRKGDLIEIPSDFQKHVLFAGVTKVNNRFVTQGGRVLNIVVTEENLSLAKSKAYEINNSIHFEGRQFRTDIGSGR